MTLGSLNPAQINSNLIASAPAPVVEMAVESEPEPQAAPSVRDLIAAKAEEAGVDKSLALRIAFCESTYRQFGKDGQPLRGIHNDNDVGLFQINEKYHLEKSIELGYDIYSTEGNIGYAMWMLKRQGPKPWVWSQPCWGAK